jgi:hypothetical protein
MSDSDKLRAEFEKWAEDNDCGITHAAASATGFYLRNITWTAWQVAYAAGQKAEREATQKEALQQLTDQAQELDMGY